MEVYIVNRKVYDKRTGTTVVSAVYANTDFDAAVARAKERALVEKKWAERLAVLNDDTVGHLWDDHAMLWEVWDSTERVAYYIAGHGIGAEW